MNQKEIIKKTTDRFKNGAIGLNVDSQNMKIYLHKIPYNARTFNQNDIEREIIEKDERQYVEITKDEFLSLKGHPYRYLIDPGNGEGPVQMGIVRDIIYDENGKATIFGDQAIASDSFDIKGLQQEYKILTNPLVSNYTHANETQNIEAVVTGKDPFNSYSRILTMEELKDQELIWKNTPDDIKEAMVSIRLSGGNNKESKYEIGNLAEIYRGQNYPVASILQNADGKTTIISNNRQMAVSNGIDLSSVLLELHGKNIENDIIENKAEISILRPGEYGFYENGCITEIDSDLIQEMNEDPRRKQIGITHNNEKVEVEGHFNGINMNGNVIIKAKDGGQSYYLVIPEHEGSDWQKNISVDMNMLSLKEDIQQCHLEWVMCEEKREATQKIEDNRGNPKMQKLISTYAKLLTQETVDTDIKDNIISYLNQSLKKFEEAEKNNISARDFEPLEGVLPKEYLHALTEEFDLERKTKTYTNGIESKTSEYDHDIETVLFESERSMDKGLSALSNYSDPKYISKFTEYWSAKLISGEQNDIDLLTALRAYQLRDNPVFKEYIDNNTITAQAVHNMEELAKLDRMQVEEGYSLKIFQESEMMRIDEVNIDISIVSPTEAIYQCDTVEFRLDSKLIQNEVNYLDQPTIYGAQVVGSYNAVDYDPYLSQKEYDELLKENYLAYRKNSEQEVDVEIE